MKTKKLQLLPIILGSDENAYGCARLFYEEYRINPLLLCSKPLPPTASSRILTRRVIKNFDSPDVFRTVISEVLKVLKNETDNLLLIPCSDYYVDLAIKNIDIIGRYIKNPLPSPAVYETLKDKAAFSSLCKKTGLSHPETVVLPPYAVHPDLLPFGFPVVLKPDNSNSSVYLHTEIKDKKKVYFCENVKTLLKVCSDLTSSGYPGKVVIQPYIPGPDKNLRVINCYCDGESNVRLIGIARPVLQYRDPASVGNYAALEVMTDRELCFEAIEFLKKIKYTGFANFDLKIHPETGKAYFLELNPRPGRSSYYIHTAGENLMKAMADDAVFKKTFRGIKYAEENGIWSNVPSSVLLKHSDFQKRKTDKAPELFFDFSPSRAFVLIRRNISNIKLFNDN